MAFLVLTVYVVQNFRQENVGPELAASYFSAEPVEGYGVRRALAAGEEDSGSISVLRQGINYHQNGDYRLALTSLRAYLAEEPLTRDYLPAYLASTAAFATGRYAESREFIEEMRRDTPSARAAFLWQSALLELREDDIAGARWHLQALSGDAADQYATAELLALLPERGNESK